MLKAPASFPFRTETQHNSYRLNTVESHISTCGDGGRHVAFEEGRTSILGPLWCGVWWALLKLTPPQKDKNPVMMITKKTFTSFRHRGVPPSRLLPTTHKSGLMSKNWTPNLQRNGFELFVGTLSPEQKRT